MGRRAMKNNKNAMADGSGNDDFLSKKNKIIS